MLHGKSVNNDDSWTPVIRMGCSGICVLKKFSHFHAQKAKNHGLQLLFYVTVNKFVLHLEGGFNPLLRPQFD